MRNLYGDLTEARYQKDTLILLQRVVDMSVDVLQLHGETDLALIDIQEEKNRLKRLLADIDQFQNDLRQTIETSFSNRPQGDVVATIGQAVTQTLQQHAKDGKAHLAQQAEEKLRELQAQVQQKSVATFEAMRGFFTNSGLPRSRRGLRCTLENGVYQADAEVEDATGICCAYRLNTGSSPFFASQKRFSDLVPGKHEIPLGTKKAWMKKEAVLDLQRIDDAALSLIADKEKTCECVFSPKGAADVLLQIVKEPEPVFRLFKLSDNAQPQPVPGDLLGRETHELLSRFWGGLQAHVVSLYEAKESLTAIRLGDKDVSEGRLYSNLVKALVDFLAPIIQEIDAHSAVDGELSLTIEHEEESKREVFFIRKDALAKRIQLLPEAQRSVFAPLGLSSKSPGAAKARKAPVRPPGPSPIREITREITGEIITGQLLTLAEDDKKTP